MSDHNMISASGIGHIWKQCEVCGCAQHGGYYWLAGWKSKECPPCDVKISELIEWSKNARPNDLDG